MLAHGNRKANGHRDMTSTVARHVFPISDRKDLDVIEGVLPSQASYCEMPKTWDLDLGIPILLGFESRVPDPVEGVGKGDNGGLIMGSHEGDKASASETSRKGGVPKKMTLTTGISRLSTTYYGLIPYSDGFGPVSKVPLPNPIGVKRWVLGPL